MLAQIRTFAKSPIAVVIFALLILSFLVFGIGDVLRAGSVKDAVIQAGSRSISSAQFKQRFDAFKKQIEQQQNNGQPITTEQAVQAGYDKALVDQLASSEAFAEVFRKAGVVPSDKLVVSELRKNQAFFDPITGKFDRATYQSRLAQGGLTEAGFETVLRDETAQTHFVSGLAAGLIVPRTYLASLATYAREGRDFSWFNLPASMAGPPVQPTDAQLMAYVKQNAPTFTKPELRGFTMVRFSPTLVAPTLKVDEAAVQKRFDFEKETLSTPETRTFVQIPVKDAAAAAQAATRLRAGENADVVAKSLGVQTVSYSDAPKTAISDRKIADAAFAAKAGDVLGPVQSAVGLQVLKVAKVNPGHEATLPEVRAKIEAEVKKDAATEKVYADVQKYEDARTGGASMAEAAKTLGLQLVAAPAPINAQGSDLLGRSLNLPPKMLEAVFSQSTGGESDVLDLGQGEYVAVRVDKILPGGLAALDEVRTAATQRYIVAEAGKRLKAKADAIEAQLKKGQTMAQAAASVGAKLETAIGSTREQAGKGEFSNDLMSKVFTAKPGDVLVADGQQLGFVVAKLEKAYPPKPADVAPMIEVQRDSFRSQVFDDIGFATRNAASNTVKPKVDYNKARTAIGLEALPEGAASGAAAPGENQVICQPERGAFAQAYGRGEGQVIWARLIDDLETPVSAYLKLAQGRPYAFLYESVEGGAWRGRYSIVAMNPDLVWRCYGDKAEVAQGPAIAAGVFTPEPLPALASLRALVAAIRMPLPAELPPMVSGLFGVLGYDMIRLFEPVGPAKPDGLGLPDAVMIRPSVVAVFDAIGQEIILSTTVRPEAGVDAGQAYEAAVARLAQIETDLRTALPSPKAVQPHDQQPPESPVSRADYHRIVEVAKSYIAAGDIFQVVPSHRFRAPFTLDPFAFYRSLRRLNPAPFLFYLNFGGFQLAGSSPEILVRLRDGKVTIRPIAGTRPRGATPEQDAEYERELLADPKERAEHLMLLDLGRNDVGRAVMLNDEGRNAPVSGPRVRVTESFKIERYSTVMHIVSNVEGEAPEGLDPVDVILTALPAGTLSGAPKVRAMQIIDELESEKRGMAYAGAAGYISANGSVDTCIILRTALFKDGMMYVQGGGGVVADSDPDAEYEETRHKTRALRRAAEEAWRFGG